MRTESWASYRAAAERGDDDEDAEHEDARWRAERTCYRCGVTDFGSKVMYIGDYDIETEEREPLPMDSVAVFENAAYYEYRLCSPCLCGIKDWLAPVTGGRTEG